MQGHDHSLRAAAVNNLSKKIINYTCTYILEAVNYSHASLCDIFFSLADSEIGLITSPLLVVIEK